MTNVSNEWVVEDLEKFERVYDQRFTSERVIVGVHRDN